MLVAELLQDHGEVVADVDQIDLAIAERRAAVAMEVNGDHLTRCGERRQHVRTEHVDRSQAAVQQQQRLTLPVNLVVIVDAIGLDTAGLARDGLARHRGRRGLGDEKGQHYGRQKLNDRAELRFSRLVGSH